MLNKESLSAHPVSSYSLKNTVFYKDVIKMYETELTIVILILQIISVSRNAFTFKVINDTFDTSQSLYRILLIDSVSTIVCVFGGLLIFIGLLVPTFHYGHVGCFILGYLSHSGFYITPFLTFLISFIRYVKCRPYS